MDLNSNSNKQGVAGRLLRKALMPVVAAAASAAASYAAKKAPQVLEDRLGPKARELMAGAGETAGDVPAKARSAAGGAGDVAEKLTERARSVAGGAVESVTGSNGHRRERVSGGDLERRREQRERARTERRKAVR